MLKQKWLGWLKKGLLLSLSVVFLFSFPLPAALGDNSDPLADFLAEQKQLQQEMDAKLKEINANKSKQKQLQTDLATVNARSERIEKEYNSAKKQLDIAQGQITVANQQIAATKQALASRQEVFQKRLRSSYMNGEVGFMDVLFDSTSFTDFLTRFDMLERLLGQDQKLLDEIEAKKAQIEAQKVALEKKCSDLEQLQSNQETALAELDSIAAQKSALVEQVENDKELAQQAYDELEKASNELAVKIRALQKESNYTGNFNGVFTWPTPGYQKVSCDYGPRIHPITKIKSTHTGIDIAAPGGANIVAAADGEVIFAGPYGVWGNAVILNHGDGITTLYAHQSKILTTKGQIVARGDVIGKVGSTGWSTGNHLHFEVRVNGNPVNPWTYLK